MQLSIRGFRPNTLANQSLEETRRISATFQAKSLARSSACRVCRAWHRNGEVRVLTPGIHGAEG